MVAVGRSDDPSWRTASRQVDRPAKVHSHSTAEGHGELANEHYLVRARVYGLHGAHRLTVARLTSENVDLAVQGGHRRVADRHS